MSSALKKILNKKTNELNNLIQEEIKLFSLPSTYVVLSTLAVTTLYKFYNNYKSKLEKNIGQSFLTEEELKSYILSRNDIKLFKKNSFNDYVIQKNNTILDKCINPNSIDETEKIINSLPTFNNTDDIIKTIKNNTEFNNLNNPNSNSTFLNSIKNNKISLSNIFLYSGLLYILYELISEIQKSKFPSPNKTKSLLFYIKTFYNDVNQSFKNTNPEWNKIKPIYEEIFVLMTALLLLASIYKFNRKKEQEESFHSIKELYKNSDCIVIEEPIDPIITSKPLDVSNVPDNICNVSEPGSSYYVPQKPFEEKLSEFSCNISDENQLESITNKSKENITTNAIIEATFKTISVKKDLEINDNNIIGTTELGNVYSPLSGKIEDIKDNKIYVSNILEPDNNLIISKGLELNNQYTNLNKIKELIKNFYIQSSYPILLSISYNQQNPAKQLLKNISKLYDAKIDNYDKLLEIYNKNIEQITSKDNIETQCKKENIESIKTSSDQEETTFLNSLKLSYNNAKNIAKITNALDSEFSLVEYYFNLLVSLQDTSEPNSIIINFINIIHNITLERFLVDGYNKVDIQERINDYVKELEGINNKEKTAFFYEIDTVWQGTKKYDSIKNYLIKRGNENSELETSKVEPLANKIVYLYKFYREVVELIKTRKPSNISKKQLTTSEAILIEGYFDSMWKQYAESNKAINDLIQDLKETIIPVYSGNISENNNEYQLYKVIEDETICGLIDNDDPYLSGKSEKSFKDYDYWLKYCTYATLTGVANPLSWSTGIILGAPVLLPIVYIPIRGFQVSWGVMVLGITICGIYPFPFLLMGNLSNNWQLPIGDITKAIKNEIKEVKKLLTTNLKELKNNIIQPYIDSKDDEIIYLQSQLDDVEYKYSIDKLNRPSTNLEVAKDKEEIITLRIQLYKAKKIYNALNNIKNDNSDSSIENKTLNDPKIGIITNSENNINKQFTKLDSLIDKLANLLAGFPAALKPNSANFTPTIKNPKPKIEIADKLDETINQNALDSINKQFKMSNEDYISTKFNSKSTQYKKYLNKVKGSLSLIIKNDPFPKYENLKITNIAWGKFLATDFTIKGGQSFGIPGNLPMPT